jgi:hypothetical protein
MSSRSLSLLTVLVLVLAACTGGGDVSDTTDATSETTTTTTEPTPEALLLAYSLEPGSSFSYEVTLDQQIDLTTEGDGAAAGDEELPGSMSIALNGTSTFTQTVAEGPEPGTFEVTIRGEFTDLDVEGTIDGEPVEPGDIPDVAEVEPIDLTIIVDEQGNLISEPGQMGDLFGGDPGGLGGLGGLENLAPGNELGRLVGPPLPDEPVTVGDSWSDTLEVPMPMGLEGNPVTTEIHSEVTGTDMIGGQEVLVIETETITSPIEFDLAEFLIGFFSAFLGEDASEADRAELDALIEDLRFLFMIDESVANMTTWFDAAAGLARQAELDSVTHMIMDLNMPDDATGEMAGFILDMDVDQTVTYRLADSAGA